jgi:hypothetical protein
MSDRGRKYQTFDGDKKTKTEINSEYYFNYVRNRVDKIEPLLPYMDEELFWELSIEEVNIYFFGN